MSRLGIFVDRKTLSSAEQLNALIRCRDAAEEMGHAAEFIFPVDIRKIPQVDGLFIRARTDPMNITYVASRMAAFAGIPVIDDPESIQVCSDKVHMYATLLREGIEIPRTLFLSYRELTHERARQVFDELGSPLVVKEPSTSFSLRVEKVQGPGELLQVARRYFKLSDWVVAQEYVESTYDWRVGVLRGRFLYACKYIIPSQTFKIQDSVNGHVVYCGVESVPPALVPPAVIDLGVRAGRAIGNGLYGVDIKEGPAGPCVIEVNDNPSLEGGEDTAYPHVYREIVHTLLET
ncbi:MAG: Glutamate--LysW ligase ArgX [Methanoregulaceae archaeon PtaU1.Bin059]|nr:MAG: Glutamate--LysW ligase ArgX [Methanoregulaceae archaeon PtaB.Bin152]OPY36593.1 MAG: Glutamate--LysW ligase ArgX [Methanoregulaceae archaeon PtaU1.Bin059]